MKPSLIIAVALAIAAHGDGGAQNASVDGAVAAPAPPQTRTRPLRARQVEQALKQSEGVPKTGVAVSTHADTVILTAGQD